MLPKAKTNEYCLKSIRYASSIAWNNIVSYFGDTNLLMKSKLYCKKSNNTTSVREGHNLTHPP